MEAATAGEPRRFDHLREHSIGLPQVLFQSITHMAPGGVPRRILEDTEHFFAVEEETGEPEDVAAEPRIAPEPA